MKTVLGSVSSGKKERNCFHELRRDRHSQGLQRARRDAGGALLESYRYDLWGNPSYFNASNTPITASGYGIVDLYAGERWVSELGLYDLHNRFMSSELGRFLQPDPIGFKGDGSNLYRYCGNDSVNKSDPMGLENPPARFLPDRQWESAKYWDTGNSFQGSFNDWMNRNSIRPQAGMGDNAGAGGPKSVSSENEGAKKQTPTANSLPLDDQATAALDYWAVWAKKHTKEVAGTINSKGEVIVGPEDKRTLKRSHPGQITRDTVAIWHIHLMVRPNPYVFSRPPYGTDTEVLKRHADKSHYVGVLNAPPGQFHIFAQTPQKPYHHYVRLGPHPFPPPTIDPD